MTTDKMMGLRGIGAFVTKTQQVLRIIIAQFTHHINWWKRSCMF